jgi:hypothetical protein
VLVLVLILVLILVRLSELKKGASRSDRRTFLGVAIPSGHPFVGVATPSPQ